MRRWGIWGTQAGLLSVLLAAALVHAGEPCKESGGGWTISWFGRPVSSTRKASSTAKKDTPGTSRAQKQAEAPAPTEAPAPGDPVARRALEEAAYLRRIEICVRLKEIALEKNDPELEQQADIMEARAYAIYLKRTTGSPGGPGETDLEGRMLNKVQAGGREKSPSAQRPAARGDYR
jgi:hypothetical protein